MEVQKRLNSIEEDLKCLKGKIHSQKCSEGKENNDKQVYTLYMRERAGQPQLKLKLKPRENKVAERKSKKVQTKEVIPHNWEGELLMDNREIYSSAVYKCLQNIGSEAVRNVTSLTEISSLSTTFTTNSLFSYVKDRKNNTNNVCMANIQHLGIEPFPPMDDKPSGDVRKTFRNASSSENIITRHNQSTEKELQFEREARKQVEAENELLKDKLKNDPQISALKQKLSEETELRQKVEKSLATLKENSENEAKKSEEKIEELCNELKVEQKLRHRIETGFDNLKAQIDKKNRNVDELEESRRLAIAMANQTRETYEEIKANENENYFYKNEIQDKIDYLTSTLEDERKENDVKTGEIEIFMKLLDESKIKSEHEKEKLIQELETKMMNIKQELEETVKELAEQKQRNPLNEPIVLEVIEKYKMAYSELKSKFNNTERELSQRHNNIQLELREELQDQQTRITDMQLKLNERENELERKESMINLLNERVSHLTKALDSEMRRYEDFSEIQKQQESLMQSLSNTITSKVSQIELVAKESSLNQQKCLELEVQTNQLKEEMKKINSENEQLKMDFRNEKDKVLTKDKMLSDQLGIIKSLRKTLEETRLFLEQQAAEYKKLKKDYNHMEYHKDDLKQQLVEMNAVIEEYKAQEERHKILLQELEYKIYEKQGKWEDQFQILNLEKEQVLQNSKLSTQKLIKAVKEYQSQILDIKNKQEILSRIIKEKDTELSGARSEIENLKRVLQEFNRA